MVWPLLLCACTRPYWSVTQRHYRRGWEFFLWEMWKCKFVPLAVQLISMIHLLDPSQDRNRTCLITVLQYSLQRMQPLNCDTANVILCAFSHWKWPSGNTVSMKECTWSLTIFRQLVRVKVIPTWMAGPKISLQTIAQSTILLLPASLLPTVHPGAIFFPPSSIAQWSSSDACLSTEGAFDWQHGHS